MSRITDTLDAACITLIRQALGIEPFDPITIDQAATRVRRAERITQAERFGVPVANFTTNDPKRIAKMLGLE